MENKDVARILRETAQLLEIDGAIIGRYRSYEKVAELLYSIPDASKNSPRTTRSSKRFPASATAWPSTSRKS